MARNIEVKLRLSPEQSAEALLAREPKLRDAGVLVQRDVFFRCPYGRLKLRFEEGRSAQLIHYERQDVPALRASDYVITAVPDAESLVRILDAALGRLGSVHKRRRLLFYDDMRVHVDDVEGLGRFLELEAPVDEAHPEPASRAAASRLLATLGLAEAEPEQLPYLELLAARER